MSLTSPRAGTGHHRSNHGALKPRGGNSATREASPQPPPPAPPPVAESRRAQRVRGARSIGITERGSCSLRRGCRNLGRADCNLMKGDCNLRRGAPPPSGLSILRRRRRAAAPPPPPRSSTHPRRAAAPPPPPRPRSAAWHLATCHLATSRHARPFARRSPRLPGSRPGSRGRLALSPIPTLPLTLAQPC